MLADPECAVYYHKDLELIREQLEIIWVYHHLKPSLPLLLECWVIGGANALKFTKFQL